MGKTQLLALDLAEPLLRKPVSRGQLLCSRSCPGSGPCVGPCLPFFSFNLLWLLGRIGQLGSEPVSSASPRRALCPSILPQHLSSCKPGLLLLGRENSCLFFSNSLDWLFIPFNPNPRDYLYLYGIYFAISYRADYWRWLKVQTFIFTCSGDVQKRLLLRLFGGWIRGWMTHFLFSALSSLACLWNASWIQDGPDQSQKQEGSSGERDLLCRFASSIRKENRTLEISRKRSLTVNVRSRVLWLLLAIIGEGNGSPLQYSCLENPVDRGAWWAAVHGIAESRTWLSDFTFHFHALEKEMATHSSVLAWRIPGTGEPGGLPSMGLHGVGHDWSDLAAAAAAPCYNRSLGIGVMALPLWQRTAWGLGFETAVG